MATTNVLTFEGLADGEQIQQFYNGGTGSLGSSGPNYGIAFGDDALAAKDSDNGGSGNFANEPSPDTTAFFLTGPGVVMNVSAGFTDGFSFFYTSLGAASVTVYDGLDATGNVLGTLSLAQNYSNNGCVGDPTGAFCHWDPVGVTFAGTARSVNFGGAANEAGFDDITLGSATPGTSNAAPTVGSIAGDTAAAEGDTKTYSVTATDPDSDALTYAWSVTSGVGQITGPSDGSSVNVNFPDGPDTVGLKVEVSDGQGHTVTQTTSVGVSNVAPTIGTLALTGNTGTACVAGNTVGIGFPFSDPALTNDTYTGSVAWGDATTPNGFTTSPVSLSHSYSAGAYTIHVNVSDSDTAAAPEKTAAVSLLYNTGTGILQPINYTGPRSSFKIGSTIPVKIKITDCAGTPVSGLAPQVSLKFQDGSADGTSVEDFYSTVPDQGTTMRYTGSPDNQYIYNLGTKGRYSGDYSVTVSNGTIAPVTAYFSLRK